MVGWIRTRVFPLAAACLVTALTLGTSTPVTPARAADSQTSSAVSGVAEVEVQALVPAVAGPVLPLRESAPLPLKQWASAHRQPVLIVLKDASGKLASQTLPVSLDIRGPGDHAVYASPFASVPIGRNQAQLQTREGVAVAYVASTQPGTLQYRITLPGGAGNQNFTGQGVFARTVQAAQRLATLSLSQETRGSLATLTVGVRDLYGLPLADGPVGVRLYLWGQGADEVAKSWTARHLPVTRSTLPGAGTAAWEVHGIALNGQWSIAYPVPASGQLQFLAVPDQGATTGSQTALRAPLVALRPPGAPAGSADPTGPGHSPGPEEPPGSDERLSPSAPPVLSGHQNRTSTDSTLRVVTYNIQHGADVKGTLNLEGTAQTLNAARFDVATLQEVESGWARSNFVDEPSALGSATRSAAAFASSLIVPPQGVHPDEPGMFGNAILSREPVRAASALALPSLVLPKRYTEPRTLLSVRVDTPAGIKDFFGTHLDLNQGERILQSQAISGYISTLPGGEVGTLSGDFNVSPDGPEVTMLLQSGLYRDAWVEKGNGNGYTYPAARPSGRIDLILVPGSWAVNGVRVIPALTSDHLPVEATVSPTDRR